MKQKNRKNIPLDDMPEFIDDSFLKIEIEEPINFRETLEIPARLLADLLFEENQAAAKKND
jgi:hypothetical protein